MPDVESLGVRDIEGLAAAEANNTRLVRTLLLRRHIALSMRNISLRIQTRHLVGNVLKADPGAQVRVRLTPACRNLRLLSGRIGLYLPADAGWPCRLRVDDVCISTRFALCSVQRRGRNCLDVVVFAGMLRVRGICATAQGAVHQFRQHALSV